MSQQNSNSWFKYDLTLRTPQSTTQEMLLSGTQKAKVPRVVRRQQLNFVSYPMNDFRLDAMPAIPKKKKKKLISSYTCDFFVMSETRCKPVEEKDSELPDWQMNRRPINDFDERAASRNKFMDDHFIMVTPERRKANFFRQLRNQSFSLGSD